MTGLPDPPRLTHTGRRPHSAALYVDRLTGISASSRISITARPRFGRLPSAPARSTTAISRTNCSIRWTRTRAGITIKAHPVAMRSPRAGENTGSIFSIRRARRFCLRSLAPLAACEGACSSSTPPRREARPSRTSSRAQTRPHIIPSSTNRFAECRHPGGAQALENSRQSGEEAIDASAKMGSASKKFSRRSSSHSAPAKPPTNSARIVFDCVFDIYRGVVA